MITKIKPISKEDQFCGYTTKGYCEEPPVGKTMDDIMINFSKISYYYYHEDETENTLVMIIDGVNETFYAYRSGRIYKRLTYNDIKHLAGKVKKFLLTKKK